MSRFARSLAFLAWLTAGLLCAAAHAAETDDSQIVADVVAGRYDRLASLEASAKRGDPKAMHWWAVLLDACAVDRCRRDEADRWWRKAAQAGNERARLQVFILHGGEATPGEPFVGIGEPRSAEEKIAWASGVLGSLGIDKTLEAQALTLLRDTDAASPTMFSMHFNLVWGRGDPMAAARALLSAGTPFEHIAGETLRRRYLLSERKRYPELLKMAQAGDDAVTLALCMTTNLIDGHAELPPALHPLCVASFERGHLDLAEVLLRHHLERQEIGVAARYARWCAVLPVTCGESISEYERLRLGDSQAWRDRDAEFGVAAGIPATDDMPLPVRQRALSRKVRRLEAQLACMRRAYLPERGGFAEAPDCPWGKPPQ